MVRSTFFTKASAMASSLPPMGCTPASSEKSNRFEDLKPLVFHENKRKIIDLSTDFPIQVGLSGHLETGLGDLVLHLVQ